MTKGSRMVGAVLGSMGAIVFVWYILNHQAGIKSWVQNLGKSLAPTPSAPTGGSTPPSAHAPPASAPVPTKPAPTPVPIVHPTYPDNTWNPRTEKIVAGTIAPIDAANLPKSTTTTNKIHPTTHTPSPQPIHQGTIPNVNEPHVNPYVQPPSQIHHISPPLKTTKQPKQPKQPRNGTACTNTKSCNGTSCCHIRCEDINTCYEPCGWSKDDYNRFLASCIHAVNIMPKK